LVVLKPGYLSFLGFIPSTALLICPGAKCFASEHSERKGGVAMLTSQLASFVVERGTNTTQRFVWVLLNLDDHLLSLANIYASNDAVERATFWC
jgi:hypothetical protein